MLAPLFLALLPLDLALDLGPCQRVFARGSGDVLHTTELRASGSTFTFHAAEFRIGWKDGAVLDSRECTSCEVSALPESFEGPGFAIRFRRKDSPFSVLAIYGGDGKHSWMYKQIRVEADESLADPPTLAFYDVERIPRREVSGGGLGRPAFVQDQLFAGIEHPLSQPLLLEDELVLRQEIGATPVRNSDSGQLEYPWSQRAILGMAASGSSVQQLFLRYLESLRPSSHPLLLVRGEALIPGDPWSDARLNDCVQKLTGIRGVDAMLPVHVLSLGPGFESIAFATMRRTLSDAHLELGLELSFTQEPSMDLRTRSRRLVEILRDGSPEYLRFCVSDVQGTGESDLFSLLRTARKVTSDAVFELDFRAEQSPWWLTLADAFSIDASKVPADGSHPCISPLIARITAEHELLRRHLTEQGALMPARALAFAPKTLAPATTAVDAQDLCDCVFLKMASGAAIPSMEELIVQAKPEDVAHIASIARWAEDRWELLSHTSFVGGSPLNRQVYGFHHSTEDQQILVLHNPDLRPRTWTLPRAKSRWLRTYPWIELLPDSGDHWCEIELQGFEVACFETVAGIRDLQEIPGSGRFRLSGRKPTESRYEIFLGARERLRFSWFDPKQNECMDRSGAVGLSGVTGQRPRGEELSPRVEGLALDEGGRCHLRVLPLTAYRGERLLLRILLEGPSLPAIASSDFQWNFRATSRIFAGAGWVLLEVQVLDVARDGVCEITLPRLESLGHVLVVLEQRMQLESAETALTHALRPAKSPPMPASLSANERRRCWQLVDAELPTIEAR